MAIYIVKKRVFRRYKGINLKFNRVLPVDLEL